MEPILDLDLDEILYNLLILGIAFTVSLPVAWDRERKSRSLGLRTFPLVAMASAGYVLVAQSMLGREAPEIARILQGLMTGIGFLGGGAIVKQGVTVYGTATAASLWCMAAIGAAVASRRFEIALVLVLINFMTLRWFKAVKKMVQEDDPSKEEDEALERERTSGEE